MRRRGTCSSRSITSATSWWSPRPWPRGRTRRWRCYLMRWPYHGSGVRPEYDSACTMGARSASSRALGARDTGRYAWQVWFPDIQRLLDALRPALTARLRASAWADHTGEIVFDLYRYTVRLRVENGAVCAVDRELSPGRGHLRAHEDRLLALVLGHRTVGKLAAWYPDFIVRRGAQPPWRLCSRSCELSCTLCTEAGERAVSSRMLRKGPSTSHPGCCARRSTAEDMKVSVHPPSHLRSPSPLCGRRLG